MTTNSFTKKLAAFVKYCNYTAELNPVDYCTVKPDPGKSNGRILKRTKDPATGLYTSSPVDHIYVRTIPEVIVPLRKEMMDREKEVERAAETPQVF